MIELLLAFEYLHDLGIVYRDLKPENILIDIDGHIKLADFGLSKQILTDKTNSFGGSPEYMSPEMLKGDPHDYRLDIYGLGALLYEMMTGLPPHYSRNVNDMYMRIIENQVEFPLYISEKPEDFMRKMLDKDPKKRFQTIEEVKSHEWFDDVVWDDYLKRKMQPEWKPSLESSNFDPEYVNLGDTAKPNENNEFKRNEAFWMENVSGSIIESNFSSRTVTEQSIFQSFTSDANFSYAFNVPENISKFNPPSMADVSNIQIDTLNINQENGHTRLGNFSFVCEPEQEHEIRKQIEQYLKIKKNKKRNSGSKGKLIANFDYLNIDKNQIFELTLNNKTIDRRFSEYK